MLNVNMLWARSGVCSLAVCIESEAQFLGKYILIYVVAICSAKAN